MPTRVMIDGEDMTAWAPQPEDSDPPPGMTKPEAIMKMSLTFRTTKAQQQSTKTLTLLLEALDQQARYAVKIEKLRKQYKRQQAQLWKLRGEK